MQDHQKLSKIKKKMRAPIKKNKNTKSHVLLINYFDHH